MIIEDIVRSISKMSDDEIRDRLKEIRSSRVTSKDVSTTKRPTKTAEKVEGDLLSAMSSLSEKDKKELIALLGGK